MSISTNLPALVINDANILDGNINPAEYFEYIGESIDIQKEFEYPINECESWEINNSRTVTDDDLSLVRQLVYAPYSETYYLQVGAHDEQSWIICAKSGEYYIHFEAGCDYTGFGCQGYGNFNYSKDWKTLWNGYMTKDARDTLLIANGYIQFSNDIASYNVNYASQHGALCNTILQDAEGVDGAETTNTTNIT